MSSRQHFSADPLDDLSEVTVKLSLRRGRRMKREVTPTVRVVAGRDMLRYALLYENEPMMIGRDETCGLTLSDASVSREHAQLTCDAQNVVTVTDRDSTNGTAVNGKAIQRALLRPGDQLEIGAVSLRLDYLGTDEVEHLERVLGRLQAADRDALTGLLTRAYLEEQLPAQMQRCQESGHPFSVIFADVDRFKSINDTFGHAVGDEVLQAIAKVIMLGVRDSDHAVRYGGEEVLVFLPGSSEQGGHEVAERIRRSINGHEWSRTCGGLRVSASLGVAERLPDEDLVSWIRRADQAMYAAKHAGRNRVVRASGLSKD